MIESQVMGDTSSMVFQLNDISLHIPKGELCCIVGKVGSGKSSLLQAMLGEMRKTSGDMIINGTVAYCPQLPWIQCGTLADNILVSYYSLKYPVFHVLTRNSLGMSLTKTNLTTFWKSVL